MDISLVNVLAVAGAFILGRAIWRLAVAAWILYKWK